MSDAAHVFPAYGQVASRAVGPKTPWTVIASGVVGDDALAGAVAVTW